MIYTIFHASNVLLQQQYRECNFTRYFELISCLLVAEQNNELLMKNHQSRPTSSTPFPEANGTSFCGNKGNHYRGRGRGRIYIYIYIIEVNGNILIILTKEMFISTRSGTTLRRTNIKTKVYRINPQRTMKIDKCYRCNMKRHLSRTCRMPKYLIDLYQASIKEKEKWIKMNFVNHINLVVIYIYFHYVVNFNFILLFYFD